MITQAKHSFNWSNLIQKVIDVNNYNIEEMFLKQFYFPN